MRASQLLALILCFNLCIKQFCDAGKESDLAELPPRGWNSYDSFSWIIDEESFLQNAEILSQKLLLLGYEYVVVDFLWYRKNVEGVSKDSYGYDSIDKWGRPIPDPDRFPSSRNNTGFSEISKKVHELGLKFGIHLMRGISTQAVDSNTPILDIHTGGVYKENNRNWTAKDIGIKERTCAWMQKGFMSVDTSLGAGKAFLRSLYQQYADWGVDFVKLDCIFGDDLDAKEIITVSELLEELDRPVVFSISPGTSVTPLMADTIDKYVNMYRITGDDWDTWADVASHFNVSRDFASVKKIGARGFRGRSWPDLDMLPLGWLTDPGVKQGPHRKCNLTLDEQKTQMTLWSIAKSPLMFGGDLRNLDAITLNLITNPTLLEINSYSSNNMEFPHVYATNNPGKESRVLLKSRKWISNSQKPGKRGLSLASCADEKAKGWFISSQIGKSDRVCWNNQSYCLFKKNIISSSGEKEYLENFHLAANEKDDVNCLDASAVRKRITSEMQNIKTSSCKWHSNQIWRLNDDGTLLNKYSNLCATINSNEETSTTIGGVKSWVATGRNGEIYLAFFNLNSVATRVTAKTSELRDFIGNSFFKKSSCNYTVVWEGKNKRLRRKISRVVNAHGCDLFVLNC
ncbi:hypothetical protein LUZ60_012591 [Juncus effusus]|nr:hypothetical protein LUZ60_012591 [Juncus effusus]